MSGVAFLFPGQGAQFVGMGREIARSLPAAQQLFERASELLGYDLAQVCWEGPEEKLNSTVFSQPALYVTSLAALEWLRREKPDVVEQCGFAAGLSLGEYSAMTFAGVLDFESGLRVVQRRGEAMQQASDVRRSGMISILGLEVPQIESLCDQARQAGEVLQVANLLCPGNTAVSGDLAALERLTDLANAAGAMKVIRLQVAGAFHTSIMESAAGKLRDALAQPSLQAPRVPVVSNVDAQPHSDVGELRELLVRQVVSPVQWETSMRYLIAQGVTQFYEVGPGRVLVGLLRRIDRKLTCENVVC